VCEISESSHGDRPTVRAGIDSDAVASDHRGGLVDGADQPVMVGSDVARPAGAGGLHVHPLTHAKGHDINQLLLHARGHVAPLIAGVVCVLTIIPKGTSPMLRMVCATWFSAEMPHGKQGNLKRGGRQQQQTKEPE